MRLIKTFILRLNIGNDQPDRICGSLQALPGRKTYSFKNDVELIHHLQTLANTAAEDDALNESKHENQEDLPGPNRPME